MVRRSARGKSSAAPKAPTTPISFPQFVHDVFTSLSTTAQSAAGSGPGLGLMGAVFGQVVAADTLRAQLKALASCRSELLPAVRRVTAAWESCATPPSVPLSAATSVAAPHAPPCAPADAELDFSAVIRLMVAMAVPEGSRKLRGQLLAVVDVLVKAAAGVAALRARVSATLQGALVDALEGRLGDSLHLRCFSLWVLLQFKPTRAEFVNLPPAVMLKSLDCVSGAMVLHAAPLLSASGADDGGATAVLGMEFVTLATLLTDALAPLQLALQLPAFVDAVREAMHGRVADVDAAAVVQRCKDIVRCCCAAMCNPNVLADVLTKTAHGALSVLSTQFPHHGKDAAEHTATVAELQTHARLIERAVQVGRDAAPDAHESLVLDLPSMELGGGANPTAVLALARAAMTCVDHRVLLVESDEGSALLPGELYRCVVRGCGHADTRVRQYAFQGLECWLHACRVATANGEVLLSEEVASTVAELCLSNWEHPSRKIASLMPVVFTKFMALEDAAAEAAAAGGGDTNVDVSQRRQALLRRLLDQPAGSHSKYSAVSVILPRVGARALLRLQPAAVTKLMTAVAAANNIAGPASSLLMGLLSSLRDEYVPRHRQEAGATKANSTATGAGAGAGASGEAAAAAAAKMSSRAKRRAKRAARKRPSAAPTLSPAEAEAVRQWQAHWIGPLAATLCDGAWRLRSRAGTYLLPELLKLGGAACVPAVAAAVRRGTEGATAVSTAAADEAERPRGGVGVGGLGKHAGAASGDVEEGWTSGARRLWAIVQVAGVARSLGFVGPNCFHYVAPTRHLRVVDDSTAASLAWEPASAAAGAQVATGASAGAGAGASSATAPLILLSSEELHAALTHAHPEVRIAALEFVCHSRSSTAMPTSKELALVCEALPVVYKVVSPQYQQRVAQAVARLLLRLQAACQNINKELCTIVKLRADPPRKADGTLVPLSLPATPAECLEWRQLKAAAAFLRWVQRWCLSSMYPSAPIERLGVALDVLLAITSTWGTDASMAEFAADCAVDSAWVSPVSNVMCETHSPSAVATLLNLLINSWDSVRSNAMKVLSGMPKPLPGITTPQDLGRLLWWAVRLTCSPRVRECDAGALLLQSTFRIYVQHLRWTVPLLQWANPAATATDAAAETPPPVDDPELFAVTETVKLLSKKTDALAVSLGGLVRGRGASAAPVPARSATTAASDVADPSSVAAGLLDMVKDDDSPMVHGVMLSLRYMLKQVNLTAKASAGSDTTAAWRRIVAAIVEQVLRAFKTVLAVVAEDFQEDGAAMLAPGDAGLSKGRVDCRGHLIMEGGDGAAADVADVEAEGQLAVTAAWLVVKECTLLLGALVTAAPLPVQDILASDADAASSPAGASASAGAGAGAGAGATTRAGPPSPDAADDPWLIDSATVFVVCENLARAMLTLKHIGGICFVASGWQMVCEKLLGQASLRPCLRDIPASWLARLLRRLERAEQQFILRRSSGFAMAFQAVFRAEPPSCKARLLHASVPRLLTLAAAASTDDMLSGKGLGAKAVVSAAVHALNVLKLLFQDRALAEDLQPFVTEAFCVAVSGFRSPVWTVRNSSMMVFANLVARLVGTKVVPDEESDANSVTAAQMFARFPPLFDFLLEQLSHAAAASDGVGAAELHPSLYPVLLLLSRLRPAVTDLDDRPLESNSLPGGVQRPEAGEGQPSPPVRKLMHFARPLLNCVFLRPLMARVMASRALVAIVPLDAVPQLLPVLVDALPTVAPDGDSGAGPHVQDHNAVHGTLLHVLRILRRLRRAAQPARTPQPGSSGDAGNEEGSIVHTCVAAVQATLPARLAYLCDARISNSAVRCAAVDVGVAWDRLRARLCLPADAGGAARREALLVHLQDLASTPAPASATAFHGPFLRSASAVVVQALLAPSRARDSRLADVTTLVQHPLEEVRVQAVKEVRAAFAAGRVPLEFAELQRFTASCVTQLASETHPSVLRHLLAVLAHIMREDTSRVAWLRDLSAMWSLLTRLHASHRNSESRCYLTYLMSRVVARVAEAWPTANGSDGGATAVEPWCGYDGVEAVVRQWCGHLVEASHDVHAIDRRFAAAEACQSCMLMHHSFPDNARPSFRGAATPSSPRDVAHAALVAGSVGVWLAAVAMLQDEDDEVRDAARRAVCAASAAHTDAADAGTVTPSAAAGDDGSVVDTVAVAIAHNALTRHYWWADRYVTYLLRCLSNVASSGEDALAAHASVKRRQLGLLSRKVFEAELDNSHLEPVVSAQYAAAHLRRVLAQRIAAAEAAGKPASSVVSRVVAGCAVRDWCHQLVQGAAQTVTQLGLALSRSNWLGGPTHQGEVFAGATASLLGAAAVAPVCVAASSDSELRAALVGTAAAAARLLATVTPRSAGDSVERACRAHPSVVAALQQLATACDADVATGARPDTGSAPDSANFGPLGDTEAGSTSTLAQPVRTSSGAERGGAFFLVLPSW